MNLVGVVATLALDISIRSSYKECGSKLAAAVWEADAAASLLHACSESMSRADGPARTGHWPVQALAACLGYGMSVF